MATVKLIWVLEEGEQQGSYLDEGRAAGRVGRAGQGVGNLACTQPHCSPVCGLSRWDSDASHALPPGWL